MFYNNARINFHRFKFLIQILTKECVGNLAHGPVTYFIRKGEKIIQLCKLISL
jgi:hypothetical protein